MPPPVQAAVKALEVSFDAAIKKVDGASAFDLLAKRQAIIDAMTAEFVKAEKQRPLD